VQKASPAKAAEQQHAQQRQLSSSGDSSWLRHRALLMCWGCWDERRLAAPQQQQQVGKAGCDV
jgi:hypothetical protein